ncbi:hypothetical protein ABKV19_003016 [Rosa sericea]
MKLKLLFMSVSTLASRAGFLVSSSSTGRGIIHTPFSSTTSTKMALESYTFGPYKKDSREVFYNTNLSYALVNLRPVVPGHILLFLV